MITQSFGDGIRVLVVDDVRLHRDNLVGMLRRESSIAEAVGAQDGEDALRQLATQHFAVALLNVATEGSLQICRALTHSTRVVALAVAGGDDEVVACAEAGVSGYLLRADPQETLVSVIASAARGETSCPPSVAAALMRRMGVRGRPPGPPTGTARLTTREREILGLIEAGMSNKEIARKLCIEVRTVKNHVHNLLEKLEVHRRGEAAALLRADQRAFPPRVPMG